MVIAPLAARLATVRSLREPGRRRLRGSGTWARRGERHAPRSIIKARCAHGALVGRGDEIELLLSRWRRAAGGEGQVVLLSGEAGIGKSRLLKTVRERIGAATVLSYQCSPLHRDVALFPVVNQMSRAIGLGNEQTAEEKVGKLVHWLKAAGLDAGDDLPLLCHLLQIKSPAYRLTDTAPHQVRERVVAMLTRQFFSLEQNRPVLAVVEDVQWIDPTMEELLIDIQSRVGQSQVMLFATNRDLFSPRWRREPHDGVAPGSASGNDGRRLIHAIADMPAGRRGAGRSRRAQYPSSSRGAVRGRRSPELREVPTGITPCSRRGWTAFRRQVAAESSVFGRQFAVADLKAVTDAARLICTP